MNNTHAQYITGLFLCRGVIVSNSVLDAVKPYMLSVSAVISSVALSLKPKQRDTHFSGLISSPPSNYWHRALLWTHTVLLPLKQRMKTATHREASTSDTYMQMRKNMSKWQNCVQRLMINKHKYKSKKAGLFICKLPLSINRTHTHTQVHLHTEYTTLI